jgi:hypothetical protein
MHRRELSPLWCLTPVANTIVNDEGSRAGPIVTTRVQYRGTDWHIRRTRRR